MTTQPQKAGTVYRFIRVPELNQNANTVVLIKNSNQSESNTKVQKNVQQVTPAKLTENSSGKKVNTPTLIHVKLLTEFVTTFLEG